MGPPHPTTRTCRSGFGRDPERSTEASRPKRFARPTAPTILLLAAFLGVSDRCFGVFGDFSALFTFDQFVLIDRCRLLHTLQADQCLVLGQLDQGHTLSVTAGTGDLVDAGTYQGALVGDQHDFFAVLHLDGTDQLAVTLAGDHGDHALTTATTTRELAQRGAFAITAF